MRFYLTESMTDPSHYVPLAIAAEVAGYDSFMVPDSICYPERASTAYPYNRDGTREFLEDKPFLEPLLLIAHLAAVTSRLRFMTSVVKLPIRHPVHVAKQATSLAVLTQNRFILGVGTSPWPEDYEVCGVPWEGRGTRMDESIDIIRRLSAGGYVEHHGMAYEIPSIKISPVPSEPLPIVIGGHGDAAIRRAALLGDGWSSATDDDELLVRVIPRLRELREEAGRAHLPFAIYVGHAKAFSPEGIQELEEIGVTDCVIGFRDPYVTGPDTQPLAEKLGALRWFAEAVMAKVR